MNYEQPSQTKMDEVQSADTSPAEGADSIDSQLLSHNVAERLFKKEKDKLEEIGKVCKEGFEADLLSRADWEKDLDEWTELAMQVRKAKNFPWPKASNVKYPLLSTAAMQFAARAYPSLIPSNGKVVQGIVIGKDDTGEKKEKADRVATYMSYQIMHKMGNWEEDMDKMLMMLPIIGTTFKKTWYDPSDDMIRSCLLTPKSLVVNYWANSLEDAERVSEIIQLSPRVYEERKRQGIFIDQDLGAPVAIEKKDKPIANNIQWSGKVDDTTPYTFIEQHTYYDLDDDGYAEPYIVTFHKETGKVVRMVARYRAEDVIEDDKKIIKINAHQYYTKFSFVPNPDGSFYSIGFGILLGPINEAVNTLINLMVDSGTVNNMQSGFIGKGLRLKMGDSRFIPGEWKPVNATGDDLRKQIVPLPAKEPSDVLFQLMGSLVTSGKELASVAEIFTGKMPGQNTPATTTMATVEQGMKVFTAVYKRIFRSLAEEFKKIYTLNSIYIDPNTYAAVIDRAVGPDDFSDDGYDICPGADPTAISQTEKLLKAQGLMELLPSGVLDPVKVVMRILDAQEQPNWQELLNPQVAQTGQLPPPPPDPKMLEMQMKGQMEQKKNAMDMQSTQQKMELESRDRQQKMAMEAQAHQQEMQHKAEMAQVEAAAENHKQRIFLAQQQMQAEQSIRHGEEQHQQTMAQTKEKQKLASQNKSTSTGAKSPSPKSSSKK